MKNKYLAILICNILILSACNPLAFDESTGQTKKEMYDYFDNWTRLVTHVYGGLPSDFGNIGGAILDAGSDDAVFTWENNQIYDMYRGYWSSTNLINDQWSDYYKMIRSANSFLENYDLESLERFKWDLGYQDNILPKAKMYPYEIRFLRAFYYFELAKYYGDVPLITKTLTAEEANAVKRTSFSGVIQFVVDECNEVVNHLPVTHSITSNGTGFLGETGRATKGAAMALKARALLYAASPLHNPGNDKSKWKAAAKAALDIIQSGTYSLDNINSDKMYDSNGGNETLKSKQLIFERRNNASNSFEANNLPYGYLGAKGGNTPTQNLVDCYEIDVDGKGNWKKFDWNNPVHVANMYKNRDPRFYKNVLFDGASFNNSGATQKIETFIGGVNAIGEGATLTGYYLRKYMNETTTQTTVNAVEKEHHYVLFRYAEVLLNYAEAAYEAFENGNSIDSELTLSAINALNQVRSAANVSVVTAVDQQFIRDERRRELAFEGHRFWDIRRWKTGDVVKSIYGISITKNNGTLSYSKNKIQERVWDDRMYLYPINKNETFINPGLGQNSGW